MLLEKIFNINLKWLEYSSYFFYFHFFEYLMELMNCYLPYIIKSYKGKDSKNENGDKHFN